MILFTFVGYGRTAHIRSASLAGDRITLQTAISKLELVIPETSRKTVAAMLREFAEELEL